jgi:ribose transport system ATP-binding protein
MKEEILRVENVIRKINGITYLNNITFQIFKGEIMGLLPLDNHGKSQLIELIIQNVPVHFGRVYFDDQLVNYYEHSSMTRNRVYLIDKETNLIQDLKVADNICVLNHTFSDYIIHEKKLQRVAAGLFQQLGIELDTDQYVSELSLLEKTIVELVRAVLNGAQLIILNELSNFLSIEELAFFQRLLRYYTQKGISFLYIANHHEEAFQICHRVMLFEKGKIIKIIAEKDFSDEILQPYILSFGRHQVTNGQHNQTGVLKCQDLWTENLKGLSFSAKKGECITILDMNNRGIQDIAAIINGFRQPESGRIVVGGKEISLAPGRNLFLDGVAYIPENPVQESLFFDISYLENLTFMLERKLKRSIIPRRVLWGIKEEYRSLVGDEIEAEDLWGLEMRSLYNLVYLRLLFYKPKVVFIMQPFSHADMYLRRRIIELINMVKAKGIAVIILAVSISDTLSITDRLLIMEDGKLVSSGQRLADLPAYVANQPQ